MLKKIFTLKYFVLGLVLGGLLLALAILGFQSGTRGKETLLILLCLGCGIASLVIALVDLVKRLRGRRAVRRSPEYADMLADYETAACFFGDRLRIGERYLFSPSAGRIFRLTNVASFSQEVHRPPRSSSYAALSAYVAREGYVKIAKYDWKKETEEEMRSLQRTLKEKRERAFRADAER